MKLTIQELVVFALLAGAAGGVVADCRPAHAGVTDDAAAVRRSLEHIDRMLSNAAQHPAKPNWYVP